MAFGVGDRIYDGLFYSYPAGHCRYHCADQSHSGAETGVAIRFSAEHLIPNLKREVTAMRKKNVMIHALVLLMFIAILAACASTPTRSSTGEFVDDTVITTKVKSSLAADDFLKSFQISVETRDGVVQLSGFVNSQAAINKAVEITRGVKGVKSIRNDLIVK
jgi:hypothetical protein